MRAAAFAFVVLSAACSDVGDRVGDDPLARTPSANLIMPGHGQDPVTEPIDLDLFPVEGPTGANVAVPDRGGITPCDLGSAELQSWADQNLACGTCYAMSCGGEVAAHVCTELCADDLHHG